MTCHSSGLCINLALKCDGFKDCDDGSDEVSCDIVTLDDDYKKTHPPALYHGNGKQTVRVYLGLVIETIYEIQEMGGSISSTCQLNAAWYDHRLRYQNLKESLPDNIVDPNTVNNMWLPPLEFDSLMETNTKQTLFIRKDSEPVLNSLDMLQEGLNYKGNENYIIYLSQHVVNSRCHFKLDHYPFDSQHCQITVQIQPLFKSQIELYLSNDTTLYEGMMQLNQFLVQDIVQNLNVENKSLMVGLTLRRIVSHHIIFTYLSTFCLMVLTCLILWIPQEHFEANIMVALTAMLVMLTLYDSINGNLPTTGSLKLIDIWLLTGLILPFLVFLTLLSVKLLSTQAEQCKLIRPNTSGKRKTPNDESTPATDYATVVGKYMRSLIAIGAIVFVIGYTIAAIIYYNQSPIRARI